MNKPHSLALWSGAAALALAGTAAFAAPTPALSRADVNAQTLAARQAGTLTPAGEAVYGAAQSPATGAHASSLTRADVAAETRAARAAGELMAAGEAVDFPRAAESQFLARSRSEVKGEVIAARAAGLLVPAGEGPRTEETIAVTRPVRSLAARSPKAGETSAR